MEFVEKSRAPLGWDVAEGSQGQNLDFVARLPARQEARQSPRQLHQGFQGAATSSRLDCPLGGVQQETGRDFLRRTMAMHRYASRGGTARRPWRLEAA